MPVSCNSYEPSRNMPSISFEQAATGQSFNGTGSHGSGQNGNAAKCAAIPMLLNGVNGEYATHRVPPIHWVDHSLPDCNAAMVAFLAWIIVLHRRTDCSQMVVVMAGHDWVHVSDQLSTKLSRSPLGQVCKVAINGDSSVESIKGQLERQLHEDLVEGKRELLGIDAEDTQSVTTALALPTSDALNSDCQVQDHLQPLLQQQPDCLTLMLDSGAEALSAYIGFAPSCHSVEAINQLSDQLTAAIRSLVNRWPLDGQDLQVKDVAWVPSAQQVEVLQFATVSVEAETPEPSDHSTLQARLGYWGAQTPEQPAIVHGNRGMTYEELNRVVAAVAYILSADYGVARETRVAFFGQRSLEAGVAILAIIHAGGAFVQVDSQLPQDRVAYILEDSACAVIITTSSDAKKIPQQSTLPVIIIDDLVDAVCLKPSPTMTVSNHLSDLAYIIYTSGTTGRPKGVMVEHGSLHNILTEPELVKYYQPGARSLLFFSISFDPHIFYLLSPLMHGATVVVMGDSPLDDLAQVDVAVVTPSFLGHINPLDFPNLRMVTVTGEACPPALVRSWAGHCEFLNIYGPAEAAIHSHVAVLHVGDEVHIGKALRNYACYVVDPKLQLVPIGVVGELLVGGIGVGRGYCNLPELTAERFFPNPFGPGRVYRTGDLVRWLPDSNLDYIGRRDNQVKLNGFRIELEEVESVAGQCSQVQQAVVLVRHNHLVCFATPELSDFAPLVDHLRQKLPHYMVPHTLVALAQFPTTVNGKVDKRALADLDINSTPHFILVADSATPDLDLDIAITEDVALDNAFAEQEAVLRQAWAELLDVPLDRIARQAHFFQLGGDSIVAILLVSKCRQQGYQLTVPTVYAHPVLASLARHLVSLNAATTNTVLCAQTPVTGPVPLTPIQQWFFGLPLRNPHHFNQSFLLKLSQPVAATVIQDALVQLLTHHDMLRCRYIQHDNQWQQTIPTMEATHDDFGWAECHATEAELSLHLAHLHSQLSLIQGPLFGALLIHLDTLPDKPRLYLVSHHVVIDLVSWRILIDDLNTLLSHQPLPPKTLSFAQWATSLDTHAATLSADCWPEQVMAADAAEPSPVDQVGTRHSIFQTLDADTTDRLVTQVCPALRVTPRDAILSAYALAYCQALAVSQVNLCMEGHGREPWLPDLDISRTVGWFTSFYPLIIHAQCTTTLGAVLFQAKERLQQIPNKGFPYFLLKYMTNASADERNKLLAKTPTHLDVLFNYFGRFTQSTSTHQSLVSIDWSDQYGEHDNPTEDWVPFDQYVMAMISGDTLRLGIDYNTRRYTNTSMTTLLTTWASHLRDLVQVFTADPLAISPAVTRFDFDLLPLTASDFDQLSTQLTQRNLSWHQVEDLYPCTPLQSGLLLSTLRNPHAYLVQYHVTLTGDLDVHRLEASWQQVALRHSILRTVFLEAPSQVTTGFVQAVLKQSIVHFDADLTKTADELSTKAYQRLHTAFALDSPLFQVSVSAPPNTTDVHQMTVTFHHAMLDGWSFPLLVGEVLKCYHDVHSPALTSSVFKPVVQQLLNSNVGDTAMPFWQTYLANAPSTPAPMLFPPSQPTSGNISYHSPLAIPKELMLAFTRHHGITLSTLLRGAYALLLSRYLDCHDVVFGVTVSGRTVGIDDIATMIGPCVNTIPFRVAMYDQSVIPWLQGLHADYIRMLPHEQCSLTRISRWCQRNDADRIFYTVTGFENQPALSSMASFDVHATAITVEEHTEYPFGVAFEDHPLHVICKLSLTGALYSSETGPAVVQHLTTLLQQIVSTDDATTVLSQLSLTEPSNLAQPLSSNGLQLTSSAANGGLQVRTATGEPCPPGLVGLISSNQGPIMTMPSANHDELAEPHRVTGLDQRPSQYVTYGYADRSGGICVAGSVCSGDKPRGFDGLLCAHLHLLGLHNCTVLPLSSRKQAVLITDDVLDTSAYLTELLEYLPTDLTPALIVSTSVFPHLHECNGAGARLAAMADVYYATLEQTSLQSAATRDQWLAVLWTTLFAERNGIPGALAGNFWDLHGTAADLVWLHHAMTAKYPNTITWQDLVNCLTLPELSQRLHGVDNALLPRFPSDPSHCMPGPLPLCTDEIPLDATWAAIWAQAMLGSADESSSWYHQRVYRVTLPMDQDRLQRAVQYTLAFEPLLRSRFAMRDGQLVQQLFATCPIPITMVTVALTVFDDYAALAAQLDSHHSPIHASHFPLWQLVVLQSHEQADLPVEAIVSLHIHPVLGPACYADQLLKTFWQQYQACGLESVNGYTMVPCASLPRSAEPLAHKPSFHADTAASEEYWLNALADTPIWLELPCDRAEIPEATTNRWECVTKTLPASTACTLHTWADEQKQSVAHVAFTAIGQYFCRLTRQAHIALGYRDLSSLPASTPGHHSPCLLRVDQPSSGKLADAVAAISTQYQQSLGHFPVPMATLMAHWQVSKGCLKRHYPQIVVEVHNDVTDECTPKHLPMASLTNSQGLAPALTIALCLGHNQSINVEARFACDELDHGYVQHLLSGLEFYIEQALCPETNLTKCLLASPTVTDMLLTEFCHPASNTDAHHQPITNLVDTIAERSQAHGHLVAVEAPNDAITYEQLLALVPRLAWSLQQHGVNAQTRVAVLAAKNIPTIATILALWTLGAIYVPIDVQLPVDRQRYMMSTAECTTIVDASSSLGANWPDALSYTSLIEAHSIQLHFSPPIASYQYSPSDLLYIVFTSGTTGQPKGIATYFSNITNLIVQDPAHLCPTPGTRHLQTTSVSFDPCIYSTLLALYQQATLVLPGSDILTSMQHANTVLLTATLLAAMDPQDYPRLKTVISGGEALSHAVAQRWIPHCNIYNGYGPSEITVMSHCTQMVAGERLSIGRPIANVTCYILDPHHNVVPRGVVGEIFVGGKGVCAGYLNRPDLNATKFIANPFGLGTLYATGDLGRWLSNGKVECLGRMDDQVKLRGFRIELDEVSEALMSYPQVQDATAIVCATQLVAFAGPATLDETMLLAHVSQRLPQYMVPNHIITMAEIPRTINGKVDHRVLRQRFQQYTKTLESAQSTGPLVQTPQQQAMTQALCAVLEIQPSAVNLTCSFIQLGGDSISAIRLASQLRQTGYTLAIPDILQRISLDTLCDQMAPQGASATLIASELTAEALLPLTLVQEWLAKLALDHSNLPHHVITIELGRPILPSQLNTALHRLISHHSALRCKWEQVSIDQGALRVLAPPTTPQPLVDIVEADDGCWQSQLGRSARLLDIQTGSLIRAVLVTQSSEAHPLRLVLLIAKLTVDDASCPILVHDLGRALDQQRLDPVPMPYDTWVAMHRPHRQPKSPMPQLTDVTMALPTAPHCLGQPNSVQDLSTYMKPLSAKTIVTLTPTIGALPDCDVSNRDIWAMATVHALAQWSTAGPVVLWHHDTDRNAYARKGDASHTVGRLDTLYPISLQLHSDTALPLAIRQIKQTLRTAQRDRYQQAFASSFDWSTPMLCSAGCGAVLLCTREEPLDYSFGHQRVAAMVNNPIETDQNEVGSLGPWAMTITVCRIETALQLKIAYSPSVLSEASVANLVTMIRASLAAIVQCYKDASASPMQLWVPADFAQVELSLADVDDLGRVLHSHRLSMDNIDAVYPCLPLQEGLLAVTASNHTAYFVQVTMSVQGQLDVAQFQSAWNRLIAQHAILRTRFLLQPLGRRQTMLQVVLKAWQPSWTLGSWLGPETAHQEHQAHIASLTQSFDLTQPLLQLGLFTAGSQDHRLVFTIHHAMIDGWSLSLLMDNLIQQYMELEPGKPESYGSVAQHVWAQDPDISHQFWSDHFSAVTAPSYLPSPTVDAARMAALAFVPNCFETLDVAMDNGSALMDMAQQHDVTLSTVLRAALAVLLQYYSGRDQVLFGVTVSGRNVPIPGIESIIGPCINTIPCLAVITPETTVASLLAALHNASAQTVPFEHSRLTDIHRCTRIDTELALFNVLLVVQNYPESLQIASSPLAIAIDSAQQNAEYPLTLVASTKADQLHVQLTFRTDVFPVDYVRQVSRHYLATLASLVQSPPATHVHHLTLLSPAEQTLLLNTYATNPHPCPVHYAHQYFETHVHQSPNTIALRDQAQSYTYAQVHRLARGLAYTLTQNSAVGRDRTVVIVADLSAGLVIAQLAVWMSGSAFVVIDPQQPLERKQFIVADSQCVAVVGLARDCDQITTALPKVPLDHLSSHSLPPDAWPMPRPDPTALAWVVYTSGTTGQPKGVQVEHRSAAHHLHAAHVWPDLREATTTHTFFTPAFDAAISELWIPLSLGGTVLVNRQDHLATLSRITRLSCSGSFLSTLDGTECPHVRTVVTGGERVTQGMVDAWADRVCLVNIYGPTEVTIATHAARLRPGQRPVIGKPLANAIGYILDQYQRPVPIGAVGELYLGGPGVARGYLNRPELTADKFITNPFGPGRLFKSGDLARWLPGGEVECLGRQDDQVKLRGYRVELGEVTHALTQHPDVRQACVMMQDNQLIGYMSPSIVNVQAVLAAVAVKVPHYMVPTALIALDVLPLTPAGKVDKRALPRYTPPVEASVATGSLADETTDVQLLPILAQVLGKPLDAAALHQTFFQLGGNSLLAFQLVAQCRRAGLKLTIADITRTATILQLSQL